MIVELMFLWSFCLRNIAITAVISTIGRIIGVGNSGIVLDGVYCRFSASPLCMVALVPPIVYMLLSTVVADNRELTFGKDAPVLHELFFGK